MKINRDKKGRFMKGFQHTKEVQEKIVKSLVGNKYRKGKTPWNKGIKGKIYLSHFKEGKIWNKGCKGFKHSKETKKKMKGRVPWNKNLTGCHIHSKEHIENLIKRRAKQIFPIKDSSIELKIQNFLKK